MSVESPLLLAAHTIASEPDRRQVEPSLFASNWEPFEAEESVVEAGRLKVRFIPGGWVGKNLPQPKEGEYLVPSDTPLSPEDVIEMEGAIPGRLSKPRKPLGFKHHIKSLSLSLVGVISTMVIVGILIGLLSFLIGVALPFDMLPEKS